MPRPSDILIEPATATDAGELLTLQRAAFVVQAQIYRDPFLPPLTQTLDELIDEIGTSRCLKATEGSRIVGSVRAKFDGPDMHIGRLVVAPDRQRLGIGSALLMAIEACALPTTTTSRLLTGQDSERNLRLYRCHGYVEQRLEKLPSGVVTIHMAKSLDSQHG